MSKRKIFLLKKHFRRIFSFCFVAPRKRPSDYWRRHLSLKLRFSHLSKPSFDGSSTLFSKTKKKIRGNFSSFPFQRTRTRKIYTDDDDDFLLEEVLDRGQRWRIDEKLRRPENFRGEFVKAMTAEGKFFVGFSSKTSPQNSIFSTFKKPVFRIR